MKQRILVTDKLADAGVKVLQAVPQFEVDVAPTRNGDELAAVIGDYHAIIVRSATMLTSEIIEKATKMRVIGRAGTGVDNINIEAANRKGIIVMNVPGGNTRSTAEHSFSMLLALSRQIPQACQSMKEGRWEKNAFKGVELEGKTIGIIGVGRIGREVGRYAQAFGMTVLACDPLISNESLAEMGFEPVDVDTMMSRADYITVHTPVNSETRHMINGERLARAKKGLRIINCARGGIVDEAALLEALNSGKVAGAALDVFETEPPTNRELIQHPNVICTPHLGASTAEAQVNVATVMAEQVRDALLDIEVRNAVNIPYISPKDRKRLGPFLSLAEKMGLCAAQLAPGGISRVDIIYSGPIGEYDVYPVTLAALKGLLEHAVGPMVNFVNAPVIARERNLVFATECTGTTPGYTDLVILKATADRGVLTLEGTVLDPAQPRIISVDGYNVDVKPWGYKIFIRNADQPGMVGRIGTVLGMHNINISDMTLGRKEKKGLAVMVLEVDELVSEEAIRQLRALDGVESVRQVSLKS